MPLRDSLGFDDLAEKVLLPSSGLDIVCRFPVADEIVKLLGLCNLVDGDDAVTRSVFRAFGVALLTSELTDLLLGDKAADC